jgi:ankyrin repeat protein
LLGYVIIMDEKIKDLLNLAEQKQEDFLKDGKYDFTKTPTTDNGGINLLHYAVMDNDFELVKYMVENGANIFAKTTDGTTVFHLLAKIDGKCNNDMKNYLIEKSGKTCEEFNNMGNGMQNPVFRWNTKCKKTPNWNCNNSGGKSKRRRNKKSTKKSRRNRKSTTK